MSWLMTWLEIQAAVRVLDRANPCRYRTLRIGLAALRHTYEEPSHAQGVLVVDRHSPFEMATEIETVRPQRQTTDGPIAAVLGLAFAHAPIDETVLELLELELEMLRPRVFVGAAQAVAHVVVHPLEMHWVAGVLLALEPVARHVREHDFAKAIVPNERLPYRQFGHWLPPHICPKQAGKFAYRIGVDAAVVFHWPRVGRVLVGLLDAGTGLVHQPAVIAAADAGALDPAVGQVGAAVRAVAVDQPEPATQILVEHQIFAHQADRLDCNRIELAGAADGHPVAAQQNAHRRTRADADEQFVLCGREQALAPVPSENQIRF
jgi:hypothetical protein